MKETEADPPANPRSALDWPRHAGVSEAVMQELEQQVLRRRRRMRRRVAGAVAGVLLVAAVGFGWRGGRMTRTEAQAPSLTVSAPSRQVLPDGTVVELNSDAEIHPDFTGALRRVVLKRGEAHFQVTKDPRRPFVVVAGKVEVRAVGTAFAVQLASRGVEVLVTEGKVAVERVQLPEAPPLAMVGAGNRTSVDVAAISQVVAPASPVVGVTAAEMAERLAWRVPQIEFSATPLREVVQVFNRYSTVQLVLTDQSAGDLRLSGIVRADNTAALRQLLQTELGVRVEPRNEREWVLSRER